MALPTYFKTALRNARSDARKRGHNLSKWNNSGFGHYSAECPDCSAKVKVFDNYRAKEASIEGNHDEMCSTRMRMRPMDRIFGRNTTEAVLTSVLQGEDLHDIIEGVTDPALFEGVDLKNHECNRNDSWWEHDADGIPLTRVCNKCQKAKLSKFRSDIKTRSSRHYGEVVDADEEAITEGRHSCPMCGGPPMLLGYLGSRTHLRCRNCGIDYSHGPTKKRQAALHRHAFGDRPTAHSGPVQRVPVNALKEIPATHGFKFSRESVLPPHVDTTTYVHPTHRESIVVDSAKGTWEHRHDPLGIQLGNGTTAQSLRDHLKNQMLLRSRRPTTRQSADE